MGKSSSSSKKIKRSSKLRSVKKKKKTKKIRRIKDYSDESDSTASLYSSSDDEYTRRKRRSKQSTKKRSRKRYSSSESDDDDDDTRLLKKKRKRRSKHVGKSKSKGSSRKRRKRDSSSTSHGSESDNVKAAPSRSKDSEPDDRGLTNSNPTRLKSIIVVSSNYGNDDTKDYSGNRELIDSDDSDERDGETSKASHPDISLEDDDLEATLKKRALENLKRFRSETQRSGMPRKEESSSAPLQTDTELVEEQKPCASPVSKDSETSLKILKAVNAMECETSLANLATHQSAKLKSSSGTTKRKLVRPVLVQESLNLASREEAAGCLDVEAETINGCTIETVSPQDSLALATKNGGENIQPTNISSTLNTQSSSHADSETLDEAIGESHSEQKTVDGTKDESQYEQKTMTVMRGGELVQVNYKVYIPKKTSSLGRRKLKR